jgi:hypothetical protein
MVVIVDRTHSVALDIEIADFEVLSRYVQLDFGGR